DSGVVGIQGGENLWIRGTVGIGDIDARGSATPSLVFSRDPLSPGLGLGGSVYIRGGDLQQTNGADFETQNDNVHALDGIISTLGQNSHGDYLWAQPIDLTGLGSPVVQIIETEGDWTFDITDPSNVVVTVSDHPYFSGDVSYL